MDIRSDEAIQGEDLNDFKLSWMTGDKPKPTTIEDNLKKPVAEPAAPTAPASEPVEPVPPAAAAAEEGPQDPPEFKTRINGNPLAVMAKHWNESGFFELPEGVDPETLDEASFNKLYFEAKAGESKAMVRQEFMEEYGIDEQVLETMKYQKSGVSQQELQEKIAATQLANVKFDDPLAEEIVPHTQQYLEIYYSDLGLAPALAAKNAARDIADSEGLDSVLDSAAAHWAKKLTTIEAAQQAKLQAQADARASTSREKAEKLKGYIAAGEFANNKFTPDQMKLVERALFDKTETIIGADGKKYKVSLVQRKRMERAQNLELDLLDAAHLVLGTSFAELKQENSKKTGQGILKDLNNMIATEIVTRPKQTATGTIVSEPLQ